MSKAKRTINGYEVVIYFDINKINPYPAQDGEWSKHESIVDGKDVTSNIPYYIEYGNKSPIYSYEGVRPVEITKEWLNNTNYINNKISQLLKSHGFTIRN